MSLSLNAHGTPLTLATTHDRTDNGGTTMTIFQSNASAFATEQPAAIDMERRSAVRLAAQLIVQGKPGRAQYEIARSVVRQARIAGLGTQHIAPSCPCGRIEGCPR